MAKKIANVQAALYALIGTALTCPVYDTAPEGTAYPNVTIGEDTSADGEADKSNGYSQEVSAQVDIWSRKLGFKEVSSIGNEITTLLGELSAPALVITGFKIIHFSVDFRKLNDPDGSTRHGILTIDLKLSQT